MDGFHEKKWFVYLGDHHEGPFSLDDITGRMKNGQVSAQNYVWCEGMADWKPMPDVPAFESVLGGNGAAHSNGNGHAAAHSEGGAFVPEAVSRAQESSAPVSSEPIVVASSEPMIETTSTDTQIPTGEPEPEKPRRRLSKGFKWAMIALVPALLMVAGLTGKLDPVLNSPGIKAATDAVSDVTRPWLFNTVGKFPALGKWFSPLPALEDVKPEEFEELKTAILAGSGEPKVAVALSRAEPTSPFFYVSSRYFGYFAEQARIFQPAPGDPDEESRTYERA
jgi:hypothetical protein